MSDVGKSLMNTLLWGGGVAAAAIAVWQFYLFVVFRDARGSLDAQGGGAHLWFAIAAAAVTCAWVLVGALRRVDQAEEFHTAS